MYGGRILSIGTASIVPRVSPRKLAFTGASRLAVLFKDPGVCLGLEEKDIWNCRRKYLVFMVIFSNNSKSIF